MRLPPPGPWVSWLLWAAGCAILFALVHGRIPPL